MSSGWGILLLYRSESAHTGWWTIEREEEEESQRTILSTDLRLREGERGKRRGSLITGRDKRRQLICCLLWVWVLGDTGMIVMSALIIWKGLMCFAGSESPVVVVFTGSMEPGFRRVLFFSPFFSHRVFLCSLGFCLKDFSIRLDLQSILLYFAGEQGTF